MSNEYLTKFLTRTESKSTQSAYRTGIRKFLTFVYSDGDLEKLTEDWVTSDIPDSTRMDQITEYLKSICDLAPKSWKLYKNVIQAFCSYYDIELKTRFWKDLNLLKKGTKAITPVRIPSPKQLREIISHCNTSGRVLTELLMRSVHIIV